MRAESDKWEPIHVYKALVRRFQLAVEEDEALPRMARLTDGFAVGDLVQLLHRTPHLNVAGVEAARAISTPHALQGLKLHHSNVRWSDIGGLDVAKATLKQTLEWPTLYARLFASSPIKLPTGLLLYGHTGTGKTLLANAAAAECGLNFFRFSFSHFLECSLFHEPLKCCGSRAAVQVHWSVRFERVVFLFST